MAISDTLLREVEALGSQSVVWTGSKFLPPASVVQSQHNFKPALDYMSSSQAAAFPALWKIWKVNPGTIGVACPQSVSDPMKNVHLMCSPLVSWDLCIP